MSSSKVDDTDSGSEQEDRVSTLLQSFLIKGSRRERVYVPRFQLRLEILRAWCISIPLGTSSSVLDIGCGQGESAITMALYLGPRAHITAIDTAPPEYGVPFTVAQVHDFISHSKLGRQIDFHLRTDAETLLTGDQKPPRIDAATLCLGLWYFPTTASVSSLFQTLATAGVSRVYVAEYDFASSKLTQLPHVLAARAQAYLHQCKKPSSGPDPQEPNVRAAMAVEDIRCAALDAGFKVVREGRILPAPHMLEGHFEVLHVLSDNFVAAVHQETPQQEEELLAMVSAVKAAADDIGIEKGGHVQAMDIWWAELHVGPS